MYHPLEIFIGLRYTGAKRRNHFISFISLISMLGVALGVTALITVLSVMNGFESEVRDRMLGMASHVVVTELDGRLDDWRALENQLKDQEDVIGMAPFLEGQVMLANGRRVSGTLLNGILPELQPRVTDIDEQIVVGEMTDLHAGSFSIVLGQQLADSLNVAVGDQVTVITPEASVTPAGILPRFRRFDVVAIFEVGVPQYDRNVAYIHINDAQRLLRFGEEISGIRLKLDDLYKAPMMSRQLEQELGFAYWVRDWAQLHPSYFKAVQTEKTMMFIILALIVAVAAFNIVSTLVMVVTDKQSDIAILRTLGLSPGEVMRIFMVQGFVIGLIGTIIGVIGGVLLAVNIDDIVKFVEELLKVKVLSPEVYYISDFPSDLRWSDVSRIALMSFSLSLIATIYPAWRASRTQPAEALRYE